MSAWFEVITAAALQPWMALAPGLLLASLRWLGCLCWLPAGVTWRIRLALSLLLGIVVLPVSGSTASWIAESGNLAMLALHALLAAAGELILGGVLGLGARLTFVSLQLAGELVDHQAGLAFQQVLNPFSEQCVGPSGSILTCFGIATVLTLSPAGGELLLADALLQQFAAIPVGSVSMDHLQSALPLMVIEQSLILAVRIAGPVLAALSLITTGAALLGRSAPQLALGSVVAPVRVTLCVALLVGALPETAELMAQSIEMLAGTGIATQ